MKRCIVDLPPGSIFKSNDNKVWIKTNQRRHKIGNIKVFSVETGEEDGFNDSAQVTPLNADFTEKKATFGDLKPGDKFSFNNKTFIKSNTYYNYAKANCFCTSLNMICHFEDDVEVDV